MNYLCCALAGMGVLGFFGGCTSSGPQPPTDRFIVSADGAPFYKYGPAQAFGADAVIPKGQPLTMLKREYGYSQVRLQNGQSGYMPTDDLAVAPPEPTPLPATPPPKQRSRMAGGQPRRSSIQPVPSDPLFDITDVPLPLPDEPATPQPAGAGAAKPKPGFRGNAPKIR